MVGTAGVEPALLLGPGGFRGGNRPRSSPVLTPPLLEPVRGTRVTDHKVRRRAPPARGCQLVCGLTTAAERLGSRIGCGGRTRTFIGGFKARGPAVRRRRSGGRSGSRTPLTGFADQRLAARPTHPGGRSGTRTRTTLRSRHASEVAAFHSHSFPWGFETSDSYEAGMSNACPEPFRGRFPWARTTWSAACEAAQLSGLMSALKPWPTTRPTNSWT